MKKNVIKKIVMLLAVCAVSAFACMASGCNVTDKIKEKIEQARCEHEWNDGEVTKEATCTEKGELTKTCTLCEKVETEEIELAEHIAVYVQAVTPTCLEKGVTDGTVCSVCETKISGFQEIPALGHIVVKDSAVAPSCLEDGLTEGEHCSRCNEVLVQQAIVPAKGHNLVILPGVDSTCITPGKTQGVWCDRCKVVYTEQETIPVQTEHNYVDNICTNCGMVKYLFDDSTLYTETDVVKEEKVAGYWYRFYRYETEPSSLWTNYGFSLGDLESPSAVSDGLKTFSIIAMPKTTTEEYRLNAYLYSGVLGYFAVFENVEAVYTEDYIDVWIPVGATIFVDVGEASGLSDYYLTVTEDTYISSIGEYANVKRLVLND